MRIKVRVVELDEDAHPDDISEDECQGGGGDGEGEVKHLVALGVEDALCECPAGVRGGCHHTAMVLFLCRMLRMTDEELKRFNPRTVTGRACAWIKQNCKGGRSTEECPFYGMTLSQITVAVREMRNPKGQMGLADDAPIGTRGVTAIDRMTDFNPHPSGGKWAEKKLHFDRGVDMSKSKRDKFMAFVNRERKTPNQRVGLDVLPLLVREEES